MLNRTSLHPAGAHVEWSVDDAESYLTLDVEVIDEHVNRSEVTIFVTWEDLANLCEILTAQRKVSDVLLRRARAALAERDEDRHLQALDVEQDNAPGSALVREFTRPDENLRNGF